jgi:hypothetical protein
MPRKVGTKNKVTYIADQHQKEGRSVASFRNMLTTLSKAFPQEISQKPVLLANFKAYTPDLRKPYLRRLKNSADERDCILGRLKTRMTNLNRNLSFEARSKTAEPPLTLRPRRLARPQPSSSNSRQRRRPPMTNGTRPIPRPSTCVPSKASSRKLGLGGQNFVRASRQ